MPKFAVLMRYEVVTGLVVEAKTEEEAVELAAAYEEVVHDTAADTETVGLSARIWGGGTVDIEQAEDAEDAEELIDDWIDELEDLDDLDDEDDDDDENSDASNGR